MWIKAFFSNLASETRRRWRGGPCVRETLISSQRCDVLLTTPSTELFSPVTRWKFGSFFSRRLVPSPTTGRRAAEYLFQYFTKAFEDTFIEFPAQPAGFTLFISKPFCDRRRISFSRHNALLGSNYFRRKGRPVLFKTRRVCFFLFSPTSG